ncbi:siderophore ABC transporter substrate-binding protein [Lysinibacillus macroides]|uniref:Ferrichrome ABC transporter substrate-binding protein n=1 Tax=Lysinibacillus macroides TaxID=33935 RepID=A0A0M9DHQ7_9BACI|nr:siderophore ABC transporter substrate-binding protein [Lysinibacillus macroides]KOY80412.1 ferrichrome ABC transporter substrate-binding protein [Lysinibacillus macroides]QPR67724.1 siderophore ABC transporter substrate-binding protein [Lysinibacillus macroides]
MKKWKLLTVLMAMMLLVLAACSSKEDSKEEDKGDDSAAKPAEEQSEESSIFPLTIPGSTVEGRDGNTTFEEVTLDKIPEKVVVFDNGFLDTLDALGVEPTAVVQDSLPAYLSKYKDSKYVNAGTLFEPDYEKLSEINPDVIFISGRASAAYAELSKIAPTVYVGVDNKNFLESFKVNVELAGKIFGKEQEAAAALADYEAKVEEVKGKAAASEEKALIVLGSEGSLSVFGPGSRFGVVHDVFGVKAVAEADGFKIDSHGDNASFEFVREKNPDILFVVDRDAVVNENGESGTKAAIENEIVSATNAIKNGKVFYLDPEVWYLSGGGLQSESLKADDVLKAFN